LATCSGQWINIHAEHYGWYRRTSTAVSGQFHRRLYAIWVPQSTYFDNWPTLKENK
jgi:hypothetical protein